MAQTGGKAAAGQWASDLTLQQEPLLRVHERRLRGGHGEGGGVEEVHAGQEGA
jgi:hypothetical protein